MASPYLVTYRSKTCSIMARLLRPVSNPGVWLPQAPGFCHVGVEFSLSELNYIGGQSLWDETDNYPDLGLEIKEPLRTQIQYLLHDIN